MTSTNARTRLLGVGLLAAVFVAGGLAGAAVNQVRGASADGAPRPEAEGDQPRERPCRVPFGYLDLSAEQRSRVDAAFERRRHQLDAFWKDNGPRYESIVDSTRVEFRSVLTPDQLAEYDRRRAEQQQREEREREKRRQREQECEQQRRQQNEETSR
jgi:uncharacterized membrane protein